MKRIFAVLLMLAVMLLDVNSLYANQDNNNNVTPSFVNEEVITPTVVIPSPNTNVVSELLSEISVTSSVYSNKPKARFLIRINQEYNVKTAYQDIITSSDPVSAKNITDMETSPLFTSDDLQASILELDIGYKLDYYQVKTYEKINTLSMELNTEEVNQLLASSYIVSIEEDKPIVIADGPLTHVTSQEVKENSQSIPWGIHSSGSYLVQSQEQTGGDSVKVAVFDTGIANHPDLVIAGGVSFVDASTSHIDEQGHGTHIAGTIAALNNTTGVVGAAPDSQLFSIKVIDSTGTGYTSSVINGIDWAIDNDIDIINMSFVASQYSETLHLAIQQATNAGIIIVA